MRKPAGVGRATRVYNTQAGSRRREWTQPGSKNSPLVCAQHTHANNKQSASLLLVFAFSVAICYYFPYFLLYYVSLIHTQERKGGDGYSSISLPSQSFPSGFRQKLPRNKSENNKIKQADEMFISFPFSFEWNDSLKANVVVQLWTLVSANTDPKLIHIRRQKTFSICNFSAFVNR